MGGAAAEGAEAGERGQRQAGMAVGEGVMAVKERAVVARGRTVGGMGGAAVATALEVEGTQARRWAGL